MIGRDQDRIPVLVLPAAQPGNRVRRAKQ
jgi:hypothetical protein